METENKFEIGDVVTLRGSNQRMVVILNYEDASENIIVRVRLCDDNNEYRYNKFNQNELEKVNKFRRGDIVSLKGDSRRMTVKYNECSGGGIFVGVNWVDKFYVHHNKSYNENDLEIIY